MPRKGVIVADAAGQLHRDVQLADDVGQELAVGPAAEGGVEVDQVDPLGAAFLPAQRGLQRVAVAGLAAGLALHQPDGLAGGHIDAGGRVRLTSCPQPVREHVGRRRRRFSGWNWVADNGPSSARHERAPVLGGRVTGPRAGRVGVHEVEAFGSIAGEEREPGAADTTFQPMWGSTAAPWIRSTAPAAGQAKAAHALLRTRLEQHLHADADAEHRTAGRHPLARSPRRRRPPSMPSTQAAKAPTPGTTSPSRRAAAGIVG